MTVAESVVLWLVMAVLIVGWLQYFAERERSRDYATDLSQLIHDHDLGREDLHRSLEWGEIADRVERQEGRR